MLQNNRTARAALRATLLASAAMAAQPAHALSLTSLLTPTVSTVTTTVKTAVPTVVTVLDPVLNPVLATTASATGLKLTLLQPTTPATGGPAQAYYGKVGAFYGKVGAFYGKVGAFWGNISPYYGKVGAFYGKVGAFEGQNDPFWGSQAAFATGLGAHSAGVQLDWDNLGNFWNGVSTQWAGLSTTWAGIDAGASTSGYASITSQLKSIYDESSSFWGQAVTHRTGQSFAAGFADPLLAKYGVDLNNPNSLASLNPTQRAMFIMAWYDGLMEFTGTDHVDHWMSEVNWTPALTQIQGAGAGTVIGLLDFTVKDAPDIQDNIIKSGGISNFSIGHGAAVASLMVSAHDGSGVMGIAPNASVVQYNPFDATATAGWTDIANGMVMLAKNNASVINASLGVSGYTLHPDWNSVLANPSLRLTLKSAALVIAAGNDGSSQTKNVEWTPGNMPFIVVGSVDPTLTISDFSNRPGSACLTILGLCTGDYLMNHFVVAPGEMMLVSDDHGGFTRMSGTSFAAPLVSGAIALLQDRWPWLAKDPADSVYIILHSAKDLGAPGPDPVYGMGLLDVQASQSPLNWNSLTWYQSTNGKVTPTTAAQLRDPKAPASWDANSVYAYAFENLPNGGYRDFAIPLSSKLVGQTAMGPTGQQQQLQSYLTAGFKAWASTPAASSSGAKGLLGGLLGFRDQASVQVGQYGDMQLHMQMQPNTEDAGWRSSSNPFTTHFSLAAPQGRTEVEFGFGEGGSRLSGVSGLSLQSDYSPLHGGANPFLGLATGGVYAQTSFMVAPSLRLSAGFTQRDALRDTLALSPTDRFASDAVGHYSAVASRVGMTWRVSDRVQFNGGLTQLSEATGVLGEQSTDRNDLSGGSSTRALDVGADIDLGKGFTASAAATAGRTTTSGPQNLKIVGNGLQTSSYAVAITKNGLFGGDRARFSLSQPVYVEHGQMAYAGVQVIDRQTGELGLVSQTFDAAQGQRPLVAELMYSRSILRGQGQLGLFGRAENHGLNLEGETGQVVMGGVKLGLSF